MKPKTKERILNGIGGFFILLVVATLIDKVFILRDLPQLIWFCNVSFVFIGIAILLRKPALLLGTISVMFVPLFLWIGDFSYWVFTKQSLMGITAYLLEVSSPWRVIYTLHHVFNLVLSLTALSLLKINKQQFKQSFKYSVLIVSGLFFVTRLLVPVDGRNMNWVYPGPTVPFTLSQAAHPFAWFAAVFSMIGISLFFVSRTRFFIHE